MKPSDDEIRREAAGVEGAREFVPAVFSNEVPFLFSIAANLSRVLHLTRDEQLGIWKRVVTLYAERGRQLHQFLRDLCQPPFVECLLADEVFWGLAGPTVGRMWYAEATQYLPAVYATAALMAAGQDRLPLGRDDAALLSGFTPWRADS